MEENIRRKGKIEKTIKFVEKIKKIQEKVKTALKKAQKKMKGQANMKKKEAEKQKKKNKIILSTKNLVFKKNWQRNWQIDMLASISLTRYYLLMQSNYDCQL